MDAGALRDIHPKQKRPVGERLALLALGKVYGEELVCEPPALSSVLRSGNGLVLTFTNTGEGLSIKGERLEALRLTVDGREACYTAMVKGDKVILRAERLSTGGEAEAALAWAPYCRVNLYNSAGLPAKPFIWRG